MEELRAAGCIAVAAPGDVGDPEDARRLAEQAIARFGRIDVLVNNAGIGDTGAVLEETLESWERVMRTNLTGAFLVTQAALPALIEHRGCVISISSVNGYRPGPGWAAYSTSKAGLIMLARTIASDYGPQGVRANCICPGWIRTPMGDADMDEVAESQDTDREGAYRLTHRDNPMRRPGEPEEVASVVSFLAGPDAAYVNGVTLAVDGGTSIVDPTAVSRFRT